MWSIEIQMIVFKLQNRI